MPNLHIDARLGPERNPRQGFGAQDILRWTSGWRKLREEFKAARDSAPNAAGRVNEGSRAPTRHASVGMDEFFATSSEPARAR